MFCPVCNGVQSLHTICGSCGFEMTDCGKTSDWTSPYAPYEPIREDQSLFGHIFGASAEDACCHSVYCRQCRQSSELLIAQWL
ncbi:hypothetical protein [Paenibacillus sp. HB172176]|uniref:hypothetical protein n=1 Tax=Paenibacillus sp. HB172176 TaxID=2493690 RepID=UPI0014389779|nr:hypothetical protein [Paenibacillus sp. HB172176]